MNNTLKNISEFMESEEGKKSIQELFLQEEKKKKLKSHNSKDFIRKLNPMRILIIYSTKLKKNISQRNIIHGI